MTTVSIETYIDVFEHDFNRLVHVWQRWSSGHVHAIIWIRRCYNVSGLYFKCLDGEFRTYREHFASYLRNIILGMSCMLLVEDVTTYQEHHSRFLKKLWQRARDVLQVTCRRFHNVLVSGTCCKSLEEDVTTYQEHLVSYLKKSLQRIRKVVQVTYK